MASPRTQVLAINEIAPGRTSVIVLGDRNISHHGQYELI